MYNISFNEESIRDIKDEVGPLINQHWEEIALHRDKIELNPNWSKYEQMEDMGMFRAFIVRDHGTIIGYFAVMVVTHIHYADHKFAMNDVVFIKPEYRGSGIAPFFMAAVEDILRNDGVSVLMVNMKCHAPFDSLMEGLGYTNVERVYSKFIGE